MLFGGKDRKAATYDPNDILHCPTELLVVVTSNRTLKQTKAGLGASSINQLTVDFSLFVLHSA